MKEKVVTCDRCGAVISNEPIPEIALDHEHPLVKNHMKHGTKIYLSLQAKICVSSKVDVGWSIEQDLCTYCLRLTIFELLVK